MPRHTAQRNTKTPKVLIKYWGASSPPKPPPRPPLGGRVGATPLDIFHWKISHPSLENTKGSSPL